MTSAEKPDIRILGGNATAEEVAAVTAVIGAALDELSGERRRNGDARATAWQRSQRGLREPLRFGVWRNFTG